jgi:hypothetical protein
VVDANHARNFWKCASVRVWCTLLGVCVCVYECVRRGGWGGGGGVRLLRGKLGSSTLMPASAPTSATSTVSPLGAPPPSASGAAAAQSACVRRVRSLRRARRSRYRSDSASAASAELAATLTWPCERPARGRPPGALVDGRPAAHLPKTSARLPLLQSNDCSSSQLQPACTMGQQASPPPATGMPPPPAPSPGCGGSRCAAAAGPRRTERARRAAAGARRAAPPAQRPASG